jgi:DNA-binding NarL/FixJ family response regulator
MVRILVADVDATTRKSLALLLHHKLGIVEIAEAATPEELTHQIESYQPTLILVDWRLLLASLFTGRTISPIIQLVVLSVNADDAAPAQALGATFIHKAAPAQQVLEQLKEILQPVS